MKKSKYSKLMPIVSIMPPLSHWPDRTIPFTPEASHVNQWIAQHCGIPIENAEKVRAALSSSKEPKKKVLVFDPETKLWTGVSFNLACQVAKNQAGV